MGLVGYVILQLKYNLTIHSLLFCPAPRGSAGFVKCFPLGNSFPALPPSVLSSVFETDLFHLISHNIKCPDWHMTLGCLLSLVM